MLIGDKMSNTIHIEVIYAVLSIDIIELGLQLYALYDWIKQGSKLENRFVWLLVIFLLGIIGPIVYFWKAPRENLDI